MASLRRHSSPTSSLARHNTVLPDRAEFKGRASALTNKSNQNKNLISEQQLKNALKRLSLAEHSTKIAEDKRKDSAGSTSSKSKVQSWLSDNKKHINPKDTSSLSTDQNEVFGSVVSDNDDDDDDLVYTKVTEQK